MTYNKSLPLILIGEGAPQSIIDALSDLSLRIIKLPTDNRLPAPVSSHADMLIFHIGDRIFCNEDYYVKNKAIFSIIEEYGYTISPSSFDIKPFYPFDVALNQALIGYKFFGKKESCAGAILDYASANGYEYIPIKQGYAKCSTLVLKENAIVSADDSIIKAAKKCDIDTLRIENSLGQIVLKGYDYGFIGGASLVYENKAIFFGDLLSHKNGLEISDFCAKHGFSVLSLVKSPLIDIGGAFILPRIAH